MRRLSSNGGRSDYDLVGILPERRDQQRGIAQRQDVHRVAFGDPRRQQPKSARRRSGAVRRRWRDGEGEGEGSPSPWRFLVARPTHGRRRRLAAAPGDTAAPVLSEIV